MVLVASLEPAWAQNVLSNSRFDVGTAGWPLVLTTSPAGGLVAHDSRDADNNPSSGSARIEIPPTAGPAWAAGQCHPVVAGQSYEGTGSIFVPSGQTLSFSAIVSVAFFASTDCTGSELGSGAFGSVLHPAGPVNTWVRPALTNLQAVAGSQSASVRAFLSRVGSGETQSALFDNLVFGVAGTTPVELLSFSVD